MPFGDERCRFDNLPLVRVDDAFGPKMECVNEQETHRFYWPDPAKNSGWLFLGAREQQMEPDS